jgi:hypothetical protein
MAFKESAGGIVLGSQPSVSIIPDEDKPKSPLRRIFRCKQLLNITGLPSDMPTENTCWPFAFRYELNGDEEAGELTLLAVSRMAVTMQGWVSKRPAKTQRH